MENPVTPVKETAGGGFIRIASEHRVDMIGKGIGQQVGEQGRDTLRLHRFISQAINDFALAVQHVIHIEGVLPLGKVGLLQLPLGGIEGGGDPGMIDLAGSVADEVREPFGAVRLLEEGVLQT